jgi:CDP-diacylglycerol--glycerol-3-phosphate 3-phosphatidyltransferase
MTGHGIGPLATIWRPEPVELTAMFDGRFRVPIERAVKPVGNGLRRTGLSPDHLTIIGLVVAVAAAVVIAMGHLIGGFLLVVLATVPDLLDGALAKAAGAASQRGAFFDSVADRVTDTLLFGGLAWYVGDRYGAHAAVVPFAILALSSLISYQRSKAESLGLEAKGGLMERAERIIALCFGLVFSSILMPTLWVVLALSIVTAVQRFVKVWNQAVAAPVVVERRAVRRTRRTTRRAASMSLRTEFRRRRP